jgi:cytochrome c peroxidase
MPVSETNPVTVAGVELGRFLFYDPVLSDDSSFSCAGCHKQEFAFSDAPNKVSQRATKKKLDRNTLPLFNLAWYTGYFWDGRARTLEDQVFQPLQNHNELNLSWKKAAERIAGSTFYRKKFKRAFGNEKIDSISISHAIAQFERTLLSVNSKYDKAILKKTKLTREELEGFELAIDMTKGNCIHCHTLDGDGLGTTGLFTNNGLDTGNYTTSFTDAGLGGINKNKDDYGKFKIPSLRNLAYTAPYMHDGRFSSLNEVLDFYSEGLKNSFTIDSKMEFLHKGGSRLNTDEKKKIIAFLNTLNDASFIRNKEFSNPFRR